MKNQLSKFLSKGIVYLICIAMVFAYILPVLAESEKTEKPDATQIEETQPEDKGQTPSDSEESQEEVPADKKDTSDAKDEAPADAKDTSDAKDEAPADAKDASDAKDEAAANANSIVNFRGAGGDGSQNDPWQIGTLAGLEDLAKAVNSGNDMSEKYFILTADIGNDAKGLTTPIGKKHPFNGHFNGAGHTIVLNMNDKYENYYRGLFGRIGDKGSVANVNTDGTVVGLQHIGGICGYSRGSISNCRNSATVTGTADTGGVCGNSYGSISNCFNSGSLIGKKSDNGIEPLRFGGVCGYNYGIITNCYNSDSMKWDSTEARSIGGVCGTTIKTEKPTIINCYYDKTVCHAEKAVGDRFHYDKWHAPEGLDHVEGLPTAQMKAAAGTEPGEDWVAIDGNKKTLVDLLNDYGKGHEDWKQWTAFSDYPQYKIGVSINAYFENSEPTTTTVTVRDDYDYSNRINGKTGKGQQKVTEQEVSNNIVATTVSKKGNDNYYNSTKTTKVLSALGTGNNDATSASIYPGNILYYKDNVVKGMTVNSKVPHINRGSGEFRSTVTGKSFEIKDMELGDVADEILIDMFEQSPDKTENGFEFRIMAASSPEQLARGLNLTTDTVAEAVNHDQWNKIRSGEKNVVVVYAQQIVDTLQFTSLAYDSKGSKVSYDDYAGLFAYGTELNDQIQGRIDPNNTMLVKKVNYGRAFLVTIDLNMTGSPAEDPKVIDLEGAVKKVFEGKKDGTEAQKNALTYAKVSVKQIGDGCPQWTNKNTKSITTLPAFITYLSNHPYDKSVGKPEEEVYKLVPLSYEALAIGGKTAHWVTIENTAEQYQYAVKKASKINNLELYMRAQGNNKHYYFNTYGIDFEFFNTYGIIIEIGEALFDSNRASLVNGYWNKETFEKEDKPTGEKKTYTEKVFRWKGDIPAYKNIYGIAFTLDKGTNNSNGEAKIAIKERIYNGWGMSVHSPADKNQKEKNLTGYIRRFNLSGSKIGTDFIYNAFYLDKNQNSLDINLKGIEYPDPNSIKPEGNMSNEGIVNTVFKTLGRPGTVLRKASVGPECIMNYWADPELYGRNLYLVNAKGPDSFEAYTIPENSVVNPIK